MVSNGAHAGDITPSEAWKILSDNSKAFLIDVRTTAEWTYVGKTDISSLGKKPILLEWTIFPAMKSNPEFAAGVLSKVLDQEAPLLFLCRSGLRSEAAAILMTGEGYSACYNIANGFEGDLDDEGHRGRAGGWKVEGLPWVQG